MNVRARRIQTWKLHLSLQSFKVKLPVNIHCIAMFRIAKEMRRALTVGKWSDTPRDPKVWAQKSGGVK
jgi:hypothetical protein